MFGAGRSLGYSGATDDESRRTIHAALDAGVRLFDTAAAYGAGHAERLLGETLGNRDDVLIITKIGLPIDETTKQISVEPDTDPNNVRPAIDACLSRLQRDSIDVLLLHPNTVPVDKAMPLFDEMEKARNAGKIRAYGWSTDFTGNVKALDERPGIAGIEHAMNILFDAPAMQSCLVERNLPAFIRSPLAMGLLTGKYDAGSELAIDDVRASDDNPVAYYKQRRPNPDFLAKAGAIAELLKTNGRTMAQGAICWLWAKSPNNVPLPGARTPAQIQDTAGALAHGPLPQDVMEDIERLIDRSTDTSEREL